MAEPNRCPECGAELPAGALAGLCPKCLLAAGLESGADPQKSPGGGSDAPTTPHSIGFIPPEPASLAAHFPQLEILELLGHGGMGAVYKARQKHLDRLVALKIIRLEAADAPAFAERFNREARMLARLNHPHIVAVYDFGSVAISLREMKPLAEREGHTNPRAEREGDTELYYFLMEYVEGANLRELMREGELMPEQALAIVPQICEALQFAHDEGVVHRDIKPENILLDKRGRVKIADFGLAKLAAPSPHDFTLTGTHQVMGTPRYMAPEQMEGSHAVDHRADIYSLGVVFYEMLTGEVPAGHFEPPSKKVEIDVRLDEVVLRALAREPERRYQHASDVKTDVESISHASQPVRATRPLGEASAKPAAVATTALPPGMGPRLLLVSSMMVFSALVIAAGLVLLIIALVRESPSSDAFWGWLGGAIGCLIGGAGALAGTWNSYRQLEGAPDLLNEPNWTWLDRAMYGYTAAGLVALVAALVRVEWVLWPQVRYILLLLGGIITFQGALFLFIRGLLRRAALQELGAGQAARDEPQTPQRGGRDWVTLTREQIDNDRLPDCCIVCGQHTLERVNKNFEYQPDWAQLLSLAGCLFFLIPGLIIASLTTHRIRMACPVCRTHRDAWRRLIWAASTGWLVVPALGLIAFGVAYPLVDLKSPAVLIAPVLGVVIGLIAYLVPVIRLWRQTVGIEWMTSDYVRFCRVSAAFAREAAEMSGVAQSHSAIPGQPRLSPSTIRTAWDDWWTERDRWITNGVQGVLGLVFIVCLIMYPSFHTRSEFRSYTDGQRLRHTTITFGVPDPWFEYETYPDQRMPFRWEIAWISTSTGIMLLGFVAWCVNWQIEKAKAKATGKQLRWWHGSPSFAIAIWGVATLAAVVMGIALAEVPQRLDRPAVNNQSPPSKQQAEQNDDAADGKDATEPEKVRATNQEQP